VIPNALSAVTHPTLAGATSSLGLRGDPSSATANIRRGPLMEYLFIPITLPILAWLAWQWIALRHSDS
jgi:hypothetical protein